MRIPAIAALSLALLGGGDAWAKKSKEGEGVLVKVTVMDSDGKAIPTAVIRHPDEADRHRVNSLTGHWEGSVLYLPDGREMIFTPGMSIQFEISAPGYETTVIQYDIRKRKNNLEVSLEQIEFEEDPVEEPLIQFGRDKPRDVGTTGPAN